MRMLQIILLLGLSPFIFGQEAEFFGCCMFKEVQGTTMMVDRYLFLYGDAGNDDGRMAKMKTRVKTWMVVVFLAMLFQVRAAWLASTTWFNLTNPSLTSALCNFVDFEF